MNVHAAIRMTTVGNAFSLNVSAATMFTLLVQCDDDSSTLRLQKYDGVTFSDSDFLTLPLDTTPVARWLALDLSYIASTHQLTFTLGTSTRSQILPAELVAGELALG